MVSIPVTTVLQALKRLGVATSHVVTPEESNLYQERLKAYPVSAVIAGCKALEATAKFFPKLAEVVEATRVASHAVGDNNPRTWTTCPDCGGHGWQEFHCEGGAARSCGRTSKIQVIPRGNSDLYIGSCMTPHAYVARCTHRTTRDYAEAYSGGRKAAAGGSGS